MSSVLRMEPVRARIGNSKDMTGKVPSTHYTLPPEKNPFKSLVVDLTHRCNMECANCYLPNRTFPDMDTARLIDLLERLPERTYVRLIGGEPTLREDLPDIIYRVISLGHKPSLTTNGLKLAQLDYCHALKDAGLEHVLISMNGADDDNVYRILDNGKYARIKVRALTNVLRLGFKVNTGTIIARGVNEQTIQRQVRVVEECASRAHVDLDSMSPWRRITPVLRIKSVGTLGRHMPNASYSLNTLIEIAAQQLQLNAEDILANAVTPGLNYVRLKCDDDGALMSVMIPVQTRVGKVLLRFIDWTVNGEGVPDPDSRYRGRVTQDFQVAPFFEDVKANEYGY